MNPSTSNTCSCSISDIPDEILMEIVWYLNVRDRVSFAKSSERFHALVFEDKRLLRDLDFSEDGRLTLLTDIDEYFKNQKTSRHIRRVNLTNVTCVSSKILKNSIGQAENLVDINVQGVEFRDISELGSFLEFFKHLERLFIDWPKTTKDDVPNCRTHLHTPFGRLRSLSVRMRWTNYSPEFVTSLHLCEKLEELRIVQLCLPIDNYEDIWSIGHKQLENLNIVEFCGPGTTEVISHIAFLFTNPREWTHFIYASDLSLNGFYFERNIEVCEALGDPRFNLRHYPLSDYFLIQVILKTCNYRPEDFYCFPQQENKVPTLMKIEDVKKLLKNPSYPIRYLNIIHTITTHCNAHLVASMFSNLTELVLTNLIKRKEWPVQWTHPMKRFWRIGTPDSEDLWNRNKNSCFRIIVQNTPNLTDFTLNANTTFLADDEEWDVESLGLITGWKNLRSLNLKFIPITDGEFLIEIAKKCPRLEKLVLHSLGPGDICCYANELPQMLSHCKNLRDFTIQQKNLRQVYKILPALDNSLELKRVSVRVQARDKETEKMISAIEHLLEQCSKLVTLLYIVDGMPKVDINELSLALRRARVELNRQHFQFQLVEDGEAEDFVLEDYSPPSILCNLDVILKN